MALGLKPPLNPLQGGFTGGPEMQQVVPQQTPAAAAPFVWGEAGSRLSPDQIARQRQLAQQQMGIDMSPVGHWSQGAARVAQNIMGALDSRNLDRAEEQNSAAVQEIIAQLTTGNNPDAVTRALTMQGVPDNVRGYAELMYKQQNPAPTAPTEMQRNYDWLAQAMGPEKANQYLQGRIDPEIVAPTPGGTFIGPRSQLGMAFGAAPQNGPPPPAEAPSGVPGNFADASGAQRLLQAMGPRGFLNWQQKNRVPVRVNTPEELAALPSGTLVQSADGRTRTKP